MAANEAVSDDFQRLIDRIKKTNNTFSSILSKDPDNLVIKPDDSSKIVNAIGKNKRLLDKLEGREFEIAVVGLEKAGKSTLSNALIQVDVLPADSERCTFTKTEIRAGTENHAVVEFYTEEEFNKKFTSMLKDDLGYIKDDRVCGLSEFSWDNFDKFWKGVEQEEPSKYKDFNTSTVPDIKTMANNKRDILPFLGHEPMSFDEDGIKSIGFKKFITGFKDFKKDNENDRGGFPYAVKNVKIWSKDLGEDMRTAVLLDVPGFDSPTKLHREQTVNTLRSADAIIFVTNVGDKPNLADNQIDMLRKSEVDDDGIPLADKAFVFGNKLDKANTPNEASKNMHVLKNNVRDNFKIAENRVICGSAQAFLIDNNLVGKDFSADAAKSIIDNIKLYNNNSNGIPELKKALKDYYDNDRLRVMEKRADNNEKEVRKLLEDILEQCRSMELSDVDNADLYLDMKDALERFCVQIRGVGKTFNEEIKKASPFTKKLREQINAGANAVGKDQGGSASCFYHVKPEELQMADDSQNLPDSGDPDDCYVQGIDTVLRKNIRNRIRHDAEELVVGEIKKESDELHKRIVDKLVECLQPDDDVKADAKKAADEFITSFDSERDFTSEFRTLIGRFSGKLIDVIINRPYGSRERLDFIKKNLAEFCMLANYYNFSSPNEADHYAGPTDSKFFPLVLAHDGDEDKNNGGIASTFFVAQVKQFLNAPKVVSALTKLGLQKERSNEKIESYAKELTKLRCPSPEKVKKIFNKLTDKLVVVTPLAALKQLSVLTMLAELIDEENGSNASLPDYLSGLAEQAQPPHSRDEVRSVLDADIDCLREIFDKSIPSAIDLETAFIDFNSRAIDFIRESMNPGGNERARKWIKANTKKLKKSQFEEVEKIRSSITIRKTIANEIEAVLNAAQ